MASIKDRLLGKKEMTQAEIENGRIYSAHRAKMEKKYAEEYRASELRAVKAKARKDARQAIFNPAPPQPSGAGRVIGNIKGMMGDLNKGLTAIGDGARSIVPPETQMGSSRSRDLSGSGWSMPAFPSPSAPKQFKKGKRRSGDDLWDWSF